jgi:hypothetical protein
MTRRLWLLLALLAILVAELCPAIAHADPIDQAESEAWPLTCQTLSKGLSGDPADDAELFMAEVGQLWDFYGMSQRDAATAMGRMITDHCPQYRANLAAHCSTPKSTTECHEP